MLSSVRAGICVHAGGARGLLITVTSGLLLACTGWQPGAPDNASGRQILLLHTSEELVSNHQSQESNSTCYINTQDCMHHVHYIFGECNYYVK